MKTNRFLSLLAYQAKRLNGRWLVVFALALTFFACSSDDNKSSQPQYVTCSELEKIYDTCEDEVSSAWNSNDLYSDAFYEAKDKCAEKKICIGSSLKECWAHYTEECPEYYCHDEIKDCGE